MANCRCCGELQGVSAESSPQFLTRLELSQKGSLVAKTVVRLTSSDRTFTITLETQQGLGMSSHLAWVLWSSPQECLCREQPSKSSFKSKYRPQVTGGYRRSKGRGGSGFQLGVCRSLALRTRLGSLHHELS